MKNIVYCVAKYTLNLKMLCNFHTYTFYQIIEERLVANLLDEDASVIQKTIMFSVSTSVIG